MKRVYAVLGEPDRVGMFSLEGGHGMPKPKREAAVTWFRTWLCHDRTPIHETDEPRLTAKDIDCTPTGQINTSYPHEITIPRYAATLSRDHAAQRSAFLRSDRATITAKVLDLLGVSVPTNSIVVEDTGSIAGQNCQIRKLQITRHGQMPVPCLVYYPNAISTTGNVVVCLNDGGKADIAPNQTLIASYLNRGDILVLCDLRGFGETADPAEWNDPKYWNREYRNAMISMHIGRPIMGQRVIDVMSVLDFIASDPETKGHRVKLVANGAYGPVAIHAAYLDPRIASAEISRSIRSFTELIDNPIQHDSYSSVLCGVLKYYDLPDLVERAGRQKITFID